MQTFPLELKPLIKAIDINHVDSKRRGFPPINFEIRSPNQRPYANIGHPQYDKYMKCNDGGPDVYRNLLGPTPDESILAGLQTVYDLCTNNALPSMKPEWREHNQDSTKSRIPNPVPSTPPKTYTNYSTVYTAPITQKKPNSNGCKGEEDIFFTPRDRVSDTSYSTSCSQGNEHVSNSSYSREVSSEFRSMQRGKKKTYAKLSPCHFNPMQIAPTMVNVCDRICFSETSVPTAVTASSTSLDKSVSSKKGDSKKSKKKKDDKKSKSKDKSKKPESSKSGKKSDKKVKSPTVKTKSSKSKRSLSKGSSSSKSSSKSKSSKSSKKEKKPKKTASPKEPTVKKDSEAKTKLKVVSSDVQQVPCDNPGTDAITMPEGKVQLAGPCYPVWSISINRKSRTDLPNGLPIFRLSCQEQVLFQPGIDPYNSTDNPLILEDLNDTGITRNDVFGSNVDNLEKNTLISGFSECIEGAKTCTNCEVTSAELTSENMDKNRDTADNIKPATIMKMNGNDKKKRNKCTPKRRVSLDKTILNADEDNGERGKNNNKHKKHKQVKGKMVQNETHEDTNQPENSGTINNMADQNPIIDYSLFAYFYQDNNARPALFLNTNTAA